MHNTGSFPDCCLLSVTDGCIWIPYLARYLEIFKKPNFKVVKSKPTFIWKMLSRAELETEGSGLAAIFGLPPTPQSGRPSGWTSCSCKRTVGGTKPKGTKPNAVSKSYRWPGEPNLVVQNRKNKILSRVPGLPIRVSARGCNNRVQMCAQLSAIDVTAKTLFECLYLVLGLRKIAPWVNCSYASTTLIVQCTTISQFLWDSARLLGESWFTKQSGRVPVPSSRLSKRLLYNAFEGNFVKTHFTGQCCRGRHLRSALDQISSMLSIKGQEEVQSCGHSHGQAHGYRPSAIAGADSRQDGRADAIARGTSKIPKGEQAKSEAQFWCRSVAPMWNMEPGQLQHTYWPKVRRITQHIEHNAQWVPHLHGRIQRRRPHIAILVHARPALWMCHNVDNLAHSPRTDRDLPHV